MPKVAEIFFRENIKGSNLENISEKAMRSWGIKEASLTRFKRAHHILTQSESV